MATKLAIAGEPRRKVAVFSHERSGTHFLMNAIAINFGYLAKPWWNFDLGEPVNFHYPENIEQYFRQADGKSVLNILKSHHTAEFFGSAMRYIAREFQVFYIYRDPRDALVSNWKLIRSLPWEEGPRLESAAQFIRAEPRGAMLRYQKGQEKNMLTRWRTHVTGWLDLAQQHADYGICVLDYESLSLAFEQTMEKVGACLGQSCQDPQRPEVDRNVVGSGPGQVGGYRKYLGETDLEFVRSELGELLERLGYPG